MTVLNLPPVDKLMIEVTRACNMRCNFCPLSIDGVRTKGHMEFETYTKIIDSIAEKGITKKIGLHVLGEPLIYPEVMEAIKYAKAADLFVELTTNGTRCKPETMDALSEAGLDILIISLVSTDAEEQKSRGLKRLNHENYYQEVMDAITLSRTYDPPLHVRISMLSTWSSRFFTMDRDIDINADVEEMRHRLIDLVANMAEAAHLQHDRAIIEDGLNGVMLKRQFILKVQEDLDIFVRVFADWGNAFTDEEIVTVPYGYCPMAMKNAAILSDGSVVACCIDYAGGTTLGNAGEEPLHDILSGPAARDIYDGFQKLKVNHPYCRKCLGGASKVGAWAKSAASIWYMRLHDPTERKEVEILKPRKRLSVIREAKELLFGSAD